MQPTSAVATYRAQYPVKPMRQVEDTNLDQFRRMTIEQGMHECPEAPADSTRFPRHPSLPNDGGNAKVGRHLWVIRGDDFPVALEYCDWGKTLQSERIKHSNLTGGDPAHSGGELWFIDQDRIIVNANSGRYGAESAAEFDLIVDALRAAGFHVASTGFDSDNPAIPNAVIIGAPEWRPPL